MHLIYGVLILFAVVLFWLVALILCRKPVPGWYGKEFMQAYFWAPLGASGLCLGILVIVKAFLESSPSALDLILSAAILAVTVTIYRLLSRWVPQVDAAVTGTDTTIIPLHVKSPAQTRAPGHGTLDDGEYRKAA